MVGVLMCCAVLCCAMLCCAMLCYDCVLLQAALGLLRVCTRLLPYKESSAEPLLKSLGLLLRLDPAVAWELAAPLSAELLKMVKASAAYIRSARGWKTVCALINMTALHPEASQASFEAFSLVCKDEKLLSGSNFAPCLETALVFLDRHAKVSLGFLSWSHK